MMTKTRKKLNDFFAYTGVPQTWLARQIGIKKDSLYAITSGRVFIPKKYWSKFIEHTMGYVLLEDLVADYVANEMKKLGIVTIKEGENGKSWIVSLKASPKL